MELVYLWIDKYKNIENQGFNFSPEFKFEFDDGYLNVEKIDGIPKDFFGKNIVNVTAVVGENGTGKSSLLQFLTNFVVKGDMSRIPYGFIISYLIEGKIFVFQNVSKNFIGIIDHTDILEKVNVKLSIENLKTNHAYQFIYYNQGLKDIIRAEIDGLYNISTKSLLFDRDLEKYVNSNYNSENTSLKKATQIHEMREKRRMLKLFNAKNDINIKEIFPSFLITKVQIESPSEIMFQSRSDFNLKNIFNELENKIENNPKTRFEYLFLKAVLYNSLYDARRMESKLITLLDNTKIDNLEDLRNIIFNFLKNDENTLISHNNKEELLDLPFPRNSRYGFAIQEVYNEIISFMNNPKITVAEEFSSGDIYIFIPINEFKDKILPFIESYEHTIILGGLAPYKSDNFTDG